MSDNANNTNNQPQKLEALPALSDAHAGGQLGTDLWSSPTTFNVALRMANALAASTVIPKEFQGNPSNTLIAIEMASRMGTSPMQVMQNLYIVNGRPSWSSQYIIGVINASKKYKHELKFELTGKGDQMECYAWTTDKTGEKIIGPTISMQMAKDEGWIQKNGSKWKTMPEVMLRYRAASFFGRLYCSDMIMGIYSSEEVVEFVEIQDYETGAEAAEAAIAKNANVEVIDASDMTPADSPADPADAATEAEAVTAEQPAQEPGKPEQTTLDGYERKF